MTDLYFGFDPGKYGAFACLDSRGKLVDYRIVDLIGPVGKKSKMDISKIADTVIKLALGADNCFFGIEDVHALPKQDVSSMFDFGVSKGHMEALSVICQLLTKGAARVHRVTPQSWQKEFAIQATTSLKGLTGKEKERASRKRRNERKADACVKARRLFGPSLECRPTREKQGPADAALIAEYVRRCELGLLVRLKPGSKTG